MNPSIPNDELNRIAAKWKQDIRWSDADAFSYKEGVKAGLIIAGRLIHEMKEHKDSECDVQTVTNEITKALGK